MMQCFRGFTLAELLIALSILGLIATFTIPKILANQQNQKFNAMAKEAAGAIAAAYQAYQITPGVTTSMFANDLLKNSINYSSLDITSSIDNRPSGNGTDTDCNAVTPCYRLANGSVLRPQLCKFPALTGLYIITFLFDPDGIDTDKDDSLMFVLYADGKIMTRATVLANSGGTANCNPGAGAGTTAMDPDWWQGWK